MKNLRTLGGILVVVLSIVALPHMGLAQTKPVPQLASIVAQRVHAIAQALDAGAQDVAGLSDALLHVTPAGEIELRLNATGPIGADALAQLTALGARVVAALTVGNRSAVQAWISYDQVAAVAALPWVASVMPPDYGRPSPHPGNPFDSEGVGIHSAANIQAAGLNGSGITVGGISDGFNTPGDTPAVALAPGCAGGGPSTGLSCSPLAGHSDLGCFGGDTCTGVATGSGDEGTAMLEIVHDMAPSASLQFAEGLSGSLNHAIALLNLAAGTGLPAPSDVVTEDIGFFAEPVFEQGFVAAAGDLINLGLCGFVSVVPPVGPPSRLPPVRPPPCIPRPGTKPLCTGGRGRPVASRPRPLPCLAAAALMGRWGLFLPVLAPFLGTVGALWMSWTSPTVGATPRLISSEMQVMSSSCNGAKPSLGRLPTSTCSSWTRGLRPASTLAQRHKGSEPGLLSKRLSFPSPGSLKLS